LVLSRRRNDDKDGAAVTSGGRALQNRAEITGNARSSYDDRRVAGTAPSVVEAERSLCREAKSDTWVKSRDKWTGPRRRRHRCTVAHVQALTTNKVCAVAV